MIELNLLLFMQENFLLSLKSVGNKGRNSKF